MSDYPKLLYRAGSGIGHMLGDRPLKVENKYLCDLLTVESEDAELAALDVMAGTRPRKLPVRRSPRP